MASRPATSHPKQDDPDAYTIDFIDPLFAVVLHIGVVHAILDNHIHETFLAQYRDKTISLREIALLVLGFVNVIFSWHGYHRSVLKKPIKGGLRFYLDIICLAIYLYIILMFRDGRMVAWLFVLQFAAYLLWDVAKAKEWTPDDHVWPQGGVTAGWGLYFLAIAVAWPFTPIGPEWRVPLESVYIAMLYFGTLSYRIHKAKQYPKGQGTDMLDAVRSILFGPPPVISSPLPIKSDSPGSSQSPPTC